MDLPAISRPNPWIALAWAATLLLALATLAGVLEGMWPESWALLAMLAGALAFRIIPHRLPPVLDAAGTVAVLISVVGWVWNWYRWPPFDEVLHLLNPLVIAAASMWWFDAARFPVGCPGSARFVAAATAYGAALALGWEAIETTFLDLALWDTVSDVVLGVAGAALGGAWAARLIRAG